MIQVRNLSKRFGSIRAVEDVSFVAPDGAITGLLGANGAGKTTTMRMITGALRPDAGDVRIDDVHASHDRDDLQRRLGALLDHQGLYARLTARENLAYFGQLRGIRPGALDERLDQVLAATGLAPIAGRRTAGFSQGERMKTALGRILVHSPHNLLLDEPTNGLDVPAVRSFRAWVRGMRDTGTCVLLSSHVLAENGTPALAPHADRTAARSDPDGSDGRRLHRMGIPHSAARRRYPGHRRVAVIRLGLGLRALESKRNMGAGRPIRTPRHSSNFLWYVASAGSGRQLLELFFTCSMWSSFCRGFSTSSPAAWRCANS